MRGLFFRNVRIERRARAFGCVAAALTAALGGSANAGDFYAGKRIDFVIGGDAGGGYDIYARNIAKHLPRFIPGGPTIVPRNMPGAGSGTAAANVYRLAPKDGTTIGALFPGVVVGNLFDDRAQNLFDPTKFNYLATADNGARLCVTGAASKIKTFKDAMEQTTVMGATAAGGSTRDYADFHMRAAGAKFKIVAGYKGTVEIMLAMERGEVDGLCGLDWTSLKSQKPAWLRDGTVNILVQDGRASDPELDKRGVPSVWSFIDNERDRAAVELIIAQQSFGRPYVAPPGVPPDRLKLLRDAFSATLADKQFLDDAAAAGIDVSALDGETLQALVTKLYATPPDIVARARELIAP